MPTTRQKRWYWREWSAVVNACRAAGLDVPDRHDLHARALGRDKSMLDLSNHELDLIIAEFRAWSQPDELNLQLIPAEQQRKRKLWKLQELLRELATILQSSDTEPESTRMARARRYMWAILRDKFSNRAPEDLRDSELQLLLITLTRAVERKRAAGQSNPSDHSTADCPF